jgi:hypothetical protein
LFEQLEGRSMLSVQALLGFNGVAEANNPTPASPPDSDGAVGPSSFIEDINSTLTIYDKTTGTPITGGATTTAQTFYASVNAGSDLFDPVCVFNDVTQRFAVGIVDKVTDSSGNETAIHLDFAISKTSTPTLAASDWNFFQYDTNDKINFAITFSDYPKIGYNADGYVVSFNMFDATTPNGGYDHESIIGIANDGTSGGIRRMPVSANDFTLAPASMHGSAPGAPMWFVTSAGTNGSINVIRLNNPFAATAANVNEFGVAVATSDSAQSPGNRAA